MEKFEVRQINNLLDFDLTNLVKESKEDGFRFLERLVKDYKNGTNNFSKKNFYMVCLTKKVS